MNRAVATVTNRDIEANCPPVSPDGALKVEVSWRVGVVPPSGERQARKAPQWLSHKGFTCPKCGRIDPHGYHVENFGICALCCIEAGDAGKHGSAPGRSGSRGVRLKNDRPSKMRTCQKCGGSFRGRSNRQRFCEHCQKAAYRDTARGWDRQNRKGQDWDVSIREIEAA